MKITINMIKDHNPCEDGIKNFESKYPNYNDSLINLLSLEDINYNDKIWLVQKVVNVRILKQWSVECAEYVVDNYNKEYPSDNRINNCIEKTKLFLEGKCIEEELLWAESAARSAAYSARSAAYSARSAAYSARSAQSAAESAARSAQSAAQSAQEDINLSILIALLDNEEG